MLHVIKARRGSPSVSAPLYIREHWTSQNDDTTGWFFFLKTDTSAGRMTLCTSLFKYSKMMPALQNILGSLGKMCWNELEFTYLCLGMQLHFKCMYLCEQCTCVYMFVRLRDDSDGTFPESQCSPKRHPSLGSFVLGGAAKVTSCESSLCVCMLPLSSDSVTGSLAY